jgi:hypothetical protein
LVFGQRFLLLSFIFRPAKHLLKQQLQLSAQTKREKKRKKKMRLLTHNMLMCNVKGCHTNNFPLKIVATSVQTQDAEFNPDFLKHMIPKLDWNGIISAAKDVTLCLLLLSMLCNCSHSVFSLFLFLAVEYSFTS